MKNNLIIILSHCDSREKREILIDNIKKLKTQNFDILLLSSGDNEHDEFEFA